MKATLDISLYPLTENYKDVIINFITEAKGAFPNLQIETNGMSTQVYGEYEQLMDFLKTSAKPILKKYNAVFVVKIANGEQTMGNLPNTLK